VHFCSAFQQSRWTALMSTTMPTSKIGLWHFLRQCHFSSYLSQAQCPCQQNADFPLQLSGRPQWQDAMPFLYGSQPHQKSENSPTRSKKTITHNNTMSPYLPAKLTITPQPNNSLQQICGQSWRPITMLSP